MDYLSGKVESACFSEHTVLRRAFRAHLQLVAKALHDVEWVDSCDYGRGDEEPAIRACLAGGQLLKAVVVEAVAIQKLLASEIERVEAVLAGAPMTSRRSGESAEGQKS